MEKLVVVVGMLLIGWTGPIGGIGPAVALDESNEASTFASPAGAWEGFIAETPSRLTMIRVLLENTEGEWEGTIDIPGTAGLPLSEIRSGDADLHFELRVGEEVVVFDAQVTAEAISGHLVQGGQKFPFDLEKLPVYPEPADRVEAWKQDLDVVRTRFLEYDRSFEPETRAEFEKTLGEIEASLPERSDEEVLVALSTAVALSGNAHTRLYLLRNRTELRRLPVRLYWFSDGLFVVRATAAYRETVGCRVSGLARVESRRLRELVGRLFAGNDSWVDYKSPYFMTSPEILKGLRLIDEMERIPIRLDCPGREPFELEMAPLPLRRSREPTEAWRELSPLWQEDGDRWVTWRSDNDEIPLYLRHPARYYWMEPLAESRALYLQYNRSQNMAEGEGFADFAAKVEALVESRPIEALILDLRFNTGGNNGIAADFMERLAELERQRKIVNLYVIIGRATFSAGISHAAYLEQHSGAIFVGEPVGDELDFWSEGGNLVLPNSGLTVHFTNGFHSLSAVERPELEPYLWSDLDLVDLSPDLPVRTAFEDYAAGRDPALEEILSKQEGKGTS